MSFILRLSKFYTPIFIKKIILKKLYRITVKAFGLELPYIKRLSYSELLQHYAIYVKVQCSMVLLDSEKIQKIKQNLFVNAFIEGVKLSKLLNIKIMKDIISATELFYSIIKIDFKSNLKGEVCINYCYFSDYFSNEICRIMCFLDEGIIAGISGGYVLNFYQRITENHDCCKAELTL